MKNENVEPPFTLESATLPLPEGPYTGTEKSVLNPVVAPLDVITFTVHEISSDIRTNVVDPLLCPTQLNTDDVDGVPKTWRAGMRIAVNSLTPDWKPASSSFKVKTTTCNQNSEMCPIVHQTSDTRRAGLRQRLLVWRGQRLTEL
jgi:hypothetical protein